MNKNKEKRSKKKSLKKRSIIFSISTLLILCVIGTCVGYYIYVRNKIYTKNENIQFQTIEYENKKKDDDEVNYKEVNYKEVNGITNVLLVGTDGRDVDERARADSIIIATLDNNNK